VTSSTSVNSNLTASRFVQFCSGAKYYVLPTLVNDLKLISFTNPILHSQFYSFWTACTELKEHWRLFVLVSSFLYIFLATCAIDKAEYPAFESTSKLLSYRIVMTNSTIADTKRHVWNRDQATYRQTTGRWVLPWCECWLGPWDDWVTTTSSLTSTPTYESRPTVITPCTAYTHAHIDHNSVTDLQ